MTFRVSINDEPLNKHHVVHIFAPHGAYVKPPMSVGNRLREERERLGLSQASLAEQTGIGRNTVIRYETDKTTPGVVFIEALRSVGVDVDYVLYGVPEGQVDCPFLEGQSISLVECRKMAAGACPTHHPFKLSHWQACKQCPKNPVTGFSKSIAGLPDVDGRLLEAIIESVETRARASGKSLSPSQSARVIVLLYRAFRAAGVVEEETVADAVKLVGG